jgi:hypothetical protein
VIHRIETRYIAAGVQLRLASAAETTRLQHQAQATAPNSIFEVEPAAPKPKKGKNETRLANRALVEDFEENR